ncbi:BSD domain-containing protein 1 [Desmophyllum pertusum]|uniref:BSD domain-containing protein 1 n=1 Tax=Desmophyllum pertusum TaxID=174260 RepID=A0A9W9ZU22_9CNID|nr:BSD domain-containing protein 1 [Desmophyllum pertusum]
MAEESGGASWWGSWGTVGTEFISSVRSKSSEAMTMVKQDLAEFVSTIHQDTSTVVADTATAVKESLKVEEEEEQEGTSARFKQGVSKFLGSLSNSLRENISHVATAAAAVTSDGPEPVFDRMQARLHEIQTDPTTFCSEPYGHLAMYEEWC